MRWLLAVGCLLFATHSEAAATEVFRVVSLRDMKMTQPPRGALDVVWEALNNDTVKLGLEAATIYLGGNPKWVEFAKQAANATRVEVGADSAGEVPKIIKSWDPLDPDRPLSTGESHHRWYSPEAGWSICNGRIVRVDSIVGHGTLSWAIDHNSLRMYSYLRKRAPGEGRSWWAINIDLLLIQTAHLAEAVKLGICIPRSGTALFSFAWTESCSNCRFNIIRRSYRGPIYGLRENDFVMYGPRAQRKKAPWR